MVSRIIRLVGCCRERPSTARWPSVAEGTVSHDFDFGLAKVPAGVMFDFFALVFRASE